MNNISCCIFIGDVVGFSTANDNQRNGEIAKWKNSHFKTCNFDFQSLQFCFSITTLINIICFNNYSSSSVQLLHLSFSTFSLVLTTLSVLIFVRTNFRAFAQKSEKCAKISTVITRKGGMREN